MASSIASFVPEPIVKWVVWAASPASTVLPWYQRWLVIVRKFSHGAFVPSENCPMSRCASRWPAKIFSRTARHASGGMVSKPRPAYVSAVHSTINVLVSASIPYA